MADERLRIEQPGREELRYPPPGVARGAEDTLHAQVPEHDRVRVEPFRPSRDPLEDDSAAAPRQPDGGPGAVDRAARLEDEIEAGLGALVPAHVPRLGRTHLPPECEARRARPDEREACRADPTEQRDREQPERPGADHCRRYARS